MGVGWIATVGEQLSALSALSALAVLIVAAVSEISASGNVWVWTITVFVLVMVGVLFSNGLTNPRQTIRRVRKFSSPQRSNQTRQTRDSK